MTTRSEASRNDQRILQLISAGHPRREIARALGVSDATVKRRVRALRVRFGVRTLPELVAVASLPSPVGRMIHRWTPRDLVLVRALADGRRVAEIAAIGGWTPATTRTYLSTLYLRLGVRSGAGAVAAARADGVL